MIGTTDNRDQGHDDPKVDVVADPARPRDPARRRTRRVGRGDAADPPHEREGRDDRGNVLRGGAVEFFERALAGLINNDYRGTPPGTYSHSVFTGHGTLRPDLEREPGQAGRARRQDVEVPRPDTLRARTIASRRTSSRIWAHARATRSPGRMRPRSS